MGRVDCTLNSLIGCKSSSSVGSSSFEEADEKKEDKTESYLAHPLVVSRNEYECQAQGQSGKRAGDCKGEGVELWSSCERCLLATEFLLLK